MDGSAITDAKSVVAPLNFLVPMAEKPVAYNYEPPPGIPVRTGQRESRRVPIRDARPMIDRLSLDKEGFVLLHHETAVTDFYDEEQIKAVYYPECERVMQRATGAGRGGGLPASSRCGTSEVASASRSGVPETTTYADYCGPFLIFVV